MHQSIKSLVLTLSLSGTVLGGLSSPLYARNSNIPANVPVTREWCENENLRKIANAKQNYEHTDKSYWAKVRYDIELVNIKKEHETCLTKAALYEKQYQRDTQVYGKPFGGNTTGRTGKGARHAPPPQRKISLPH